MKYSHKHFIKLKNCPQNELNRFIINFLGPIVPRKIRKRAAKSLFDSYKNEYADKPAAILLALNYVKDNLLQNYKEGLLND